MNEDLMHLLEKQDGFILHCHFSFWRGVYINLSSSLLFWSQPNLMDLDWALHQPNFASCFHLDKKKRRLFVRIFGQGVTHSPPRKKKNNLTSTKNIHLEIKLSQFML